MQKPSEEILEHLCVMAAEQADMDRSAVTPESDFFNDLNFDSLDAVEFIMRLEDEYDISIDDGQADGVKNPRQAFELLTGALAGKGR